MSCANPTSPINLSQIVLGSITSCNYKCFYQYNYGNVSPVTKQVKIPACRNTVH